MKALELLKSDRDYCLSINNDKSIIEQYDKAIKELEELKSRSCKNCKYWNSSQLDGNSICKKLFNFRSYFDFCCNKWEPK